MHITSWSAARCIHTTDCTNVSSAAPDHQGHSKQPLEPDRDILALGYLPGNCSHSRAGSGRRINVGQLVVLNEPPASLAAIGPCASKDSTMVTIMHTSAAHPTIYIQGDPGSRVIENSHSTDVRA